MHISMEETTDEAADRRRLQRILALLAGAPGDFPVELTLHLRDGRTESLRLPGIADVEGLIPQIQPLLGVLGQARRVGREEREYAAAAI